jgi:hypothetical protein
MPRRTSARARSRLTGHGEVGADPHAVHEALATPYDAARPDHGPYELALDDRPSPTTETPPEASMFAAR